MSTNLNWKNSLSQLVDGNMRFRLGLRSVEAFASSLKLKEFAEKGQRPSAIILTCSDSRVPTEILFDKGVGDLFVIRVAGNIISDSILASIEYAALALGTPLCVVMGHTECGAVRAAVDGYVHGTPSPTAHIRDLLKEIEPSVKVVHHKKSEGIEHSELVFQTIRQNVKNQTIMIQERSSVLHELVQKGDFQIIGAIYDLHNGEVKFDDHNISASKNMTLLRSSLGSSAEIHEQA